MITVITRIESNIFGAIFGEISGITIINFKEFNKKEKTKIILKNRKYNVNQDITNLLHKAIF